MSVPLINILLFLIQLSCQAADALQDSPPAPQPHGATHVFCANLRHEHNCRMWGAGVEFSAVCLLDIEDIAGEFNDCNLQGWDRNDAA